MFLLANSVIAAAPATPLPWFTFDDYPMQAFTNQWKGTTNFEVLVAPDGKPVGCTITQSSGYEQLDKESCFVATHRAKFTPARGPDGSPAYGTYRSSVMWHRPDEQRLQGEPGPDLEVTVNALPDGTHQPAAVKLAYFVDASGRPSDCTVLPDSRNQPQQLAVAACTQLFSHLQTVPVAANGAKVPVVKTAAIYFATSK
jgi:TonB family protein